MKIIKPEVKDIVFHVPGEYTIEQWLEKAGRTCYKSEEKITEDSASKFVSMLYKRGHHAMLEHAVVSCVIAADRGLTHELVRHRLASFAQESTRYCNYSKGKFNGEIQVIEYPWKNEKSVEIHEAAAKAAETFYNMLLNMGEPPQNARAVLPISLKSEIVITANLREWIHIFEMRADTPAHPIIRGVAKEILKEFYKQVPSIYEEKYDKFIGNDKDTKEKDPNKG